MAQKGGETTPAEIVVRLDLEDRLDAAEQTVARGKTALEGARTKREVFEKYTRDKTIKELQSAVEKAKSDELIKQQVWELAKDTEAKLEQQIKNCRLLASFDGAILYANDPKPGSDRPIIEEGATVRERQKIFSVPNPDGPHAAERQGARVDGRSDPARATGAQIKVDAFTREVLTGKVESINPLPDPTSRFNQDITVFFTRRVSIDKGLAGLRPGMSAQVEILIADLDNVLSVPIASVSHFDDKDHVALQKPGGGFEWREVTLGVSNDERVEVKQGLQSGEVVIQNPRRLLSAEEKPREARQHRPRPPPGVPRVSVPGETHLAGARSDFLTTPARACGARRG